ncbi:MULTISPECIES: SMEK domain-containing protein [unclassified Bacillus cereus group]|uniref:SMEK domain-containing protein n=1 Tax=unclassified Bacillus cereus group TaxID=2750818 RepID=UPI001F57B0B7|nr:MULTISPECIES: SMEK domain-containing protein [unclassified Bacillus cereus group]
MEQISQEDELFIDYASKIAFRLNLIEAKIKTDNRLNFTDNNIRAEKYFAGLFNLIYGYNLKNLNKKIRNTPGIDLGDKKVKICYQVTSTNDKKKIDESIKKFEKYEWYKDYDRLNIFIIGTAKKYRKLLPCNAELVIGDIPWIREEIEDLPIETQIDIWNYVKVHTPLPDIDDAYQTVELINGTYSKFLKEYSIREHKKTDKKIINQLAEELSEMDITTRKLIYSIMKKAIKVDEGIIFKLYEVSKNLKWTYEEVINELNILRDKKWIESLYVEDEREKLFEVSDCVYYERGPICLSYYRNDAEWLSCIHRFLYQESKKKKQESFAVLSKRLILMLDFSVLK